MRKRNCRVQVRLDNKEYQGFMKAVRKSGLSQEAVSYTHLGGLQLLSALLFGGVG